MRPKSPRRAAEGHGCAVVAAVAVIGVILLALAGRDRPGGGPLPVLKPPVPVVVTYRNSLVGAGRVAVFSNQAPTRLTVTVEFVSKDKARRKAAAVDLSPNGTREVGWAEGWAFEAGDTVTVSHPDYSPRTYVTP
jgi:hypothetical protein